LCPICIPGAKLILSLKGLIDDIGEKYKQKGWSAEQWALSFIDEGERHTIQRALRTLEEVEMHRADIRGTWESLETWIERAVGQNSTVLLIFQDFATSVLAGREFDDLGVSPAKKWINLCGFAVWYKGRKIKLPMKYDVFSDYVDHSAWAGVFCLEVVLHHIATIEPDVLRLCTNFVSFTDNGGHFAAKIYLGSVLSRIPERYFPKATVEACHHPCYHGKTIVDSAIHHTNTFIESAIANNPARLIDTAAKTAKACNEEFKLSMARQEGYGKNKTGRDYLALACDLSGPLPGPPASLYERLVPRSTLYHSFEIEGHIRSTYCLKSAIEPVAGSREYFNCGTPAASLQGRGKYLGCHELIERVERPAPKKSTAPAHYRRALNIVDLTEKRKKRDAWAGIPERGEWEDADALLVASARKPPEGENAQEWVKAQLRLGIDKPSMSRVMVHDQGELQKGRILGQGGLTLEGVPVPSVQVEIHTLHDVYPRDFAKSEIAKMWAKEHWHFLPESFPNTMRGSTQLLLCPWGMVGEERPRDNVKGQHERVWMVCCIKCGYWRHVPAQTRKKFSAREKEFRCKDSPWLDNCSSEKSELEQKFKRVATPKERRGGD